MGPLHTFLFSNVYEVKAIYNANNLSPYTWISDDIWACYRTTKCGYNMMHSTCTSAWNFKRVASLESCGWGLLNEVSYMVVHGEEGGNDRPAPAASQIKGTRSEWTKGRVNYYTTASVPIITVALVCLSLESMGGATHSINGHRTSPVLDRVLTTDPH